MYPSRMAPALAAYVLLPCALVGCDRGARSPVAPPLAQTRAAPTVTSVSPSTGASAGGASMTIVGTGFDRETIVRFEEIPVSVTFDSRDVARTTMYLETPAHSVGSVDIVVVNPDGASLRLPAGFTYVHASSFDPNHVWIGGAFDGSDRTLSLTIDNNRVVSASCSGAAGETARLPLPEAIPVNNGEFSFQSSDGSSLSGRMVAPAEMSGTMNFAPCTSMAWRLYPPK